MWRKAEIPHMLDRRSFLRGGACSLALVSTSVFEPLALALDIPGGPVRVCFGAQRAFVGDEVLLLVRLEDPSPLSFRIQSTAHGWRTELRIAAQRGWTELAWRVPPDAVLRKPGVYRIELQVRRQGELRWLSATRPLEVLVNRFAFGL